MKPRLFQIYLHSLLFIGYLHYEFKHDTNSLLHNKRIVINKYETHWQRKGNNIHLV